MEPAQGVDVTLGALLESISTLTAVAALTAAVWAALTSRSLLRVEMERDQDRRQQEDAWQVSHVGAWSVFCPEVVPSAAMRRDGILISNRSPAAVFDVRIESSDLRGEPQREVALSFAPPGEFVVLGHPTYRWTFPLQRDEISGPIRPVTKHAKWRVTAVELTDASGRRWRREGGALTRIDPQP